MPTKKYYTVKITAKAQATMWYNQHIGKQFKTELAIIQNGAGKTVPVFKCVESPFFHIYPVHCTVISEITLTL